MMKIILLNFYIKDVDIKFFLCIKICLLCFLKIGIGLILS